jgi:Mn2+/Fe2+ NRAMP family transporter
LREFAILHVNNIYPCTANPFCGFTGHPQPLTKSLTVIVMFLGHIITVCFFCIHSWFILTKTTNDEKFVMVLGHMITLCFSYSMNNHEIDTEFHYSWNFSKCNKMTITMLYLLHILFFHYFFMPQHHISWWATIIKP